MLTIHPDVVDGRPRSEQDTEGWVTVERVFKVTEVTGIGTRKHLNALAVVGMPEIGDRHPRIADMEVVRLIPATEDQDVVRVTIVYARRDSPDNADYIRTTYDATLEQADTNTDKDGVALSATYTPIGGGETITASPTMPKLFPRAVWSLSFRIDGVPGNELIDLLGTVNDSVWANYEPRTWLCVSFRADSDDNDKHTDIVVVFEYKPDTWDGEWLYFGPDGLVPDDAKASTGNGYLKAEIYPTADFSIVGVSGG